MERILWEVSVTRLLNDPASVSAFGQHMSSPHRRAASCPPNVTSTPHPRLVVTSQRAAALCSLTYCFRSLPHTVRSSSLLGRKNKDCLCETCEKKGKGGYAPRQEGVDDVSESDISGSSEIDRSRRFWDAAEEEGKLNLHVRKTRRGTYALDKRATTSATPAASGTPAVASTSATPAIASTSATPAIASTHAAGSSATPGGASTPADIIEVEMELEVEPEKAADAVNVTPAVSVLSELPTLSSLSSSPSEMPTRAPTPEPLVRAVTPTVDIPPPPSPGPYVPIDLDAYKPDALTAHFPPGLVRLTNPETIARLVLRRDDMNARASTRGLPHPSLHPLLAAAENYPKFPPTAEPTHFVVSAALVDPHHTTFDFFNCTSSSWT